mgnify:FL=1
MAWAPRFYRFCLYHVYARKDTSDRKNPKQNTELHGLTLMAVRLCPPERIRLFRQGGSGTHNKKTIRQAGIKWISKKFSVIVKIYFISRTEKQGSDRQRSRPCTRFAAESPGDTGVSGRKKTVPSALVQPGGGEPNKKNLSSGALFCASGSGTHASGQRR